MPTTIQRYLPLCLLVILGITWGTGYSIARFAMLNGVNPLGYSFWQSLGPAVFISVFTLIRFKKIEFSEEHFRYYFICGLTGIAIPNTNMYFAASHLPAGLLAVVVNTVPIMAYLMALAARIERFSLLRLTSVAIALCGLMLLLVPKTSLPTPDMMPWVLMALLTPLCFAFCAVYITRFRPQQGNAYSFAAGTLIFSSILLAPLVIGSGNFYMFHLPFNAADWVVLLEMILSSIGYIVFFQLLKLAGPVYYSFVDTVVAITGLTWGYIIFGEKLNIYTGSAVFLILISLILISQRQANRLK